MHANRTALAALLSIGLAVVPSAAAAQTADTEPAAVSYWTATETVGPRFVPPGAEVEFFDWGYRNTMGLTYDIEADDPRAAGTVSIVFVFDQPRGGSMGRGTGIARLVNEGGTFEGPLHVVYYPDGSEFRMALMEGHGGYEGLAYSMTNYISPTGEEQSQGLIWEGEPPPVPAVDMLPD
jgi:hypothetical protein